jgi:hypothetical protein
MPEAFKLLKPPPIGELSLSAFFEQLTDNPIIVARHIMFIFLIVFSLILV